MLSAGTEEMPKEVSRNADSCILRVANKKAMKKKINGVFYVDSVIAAACRS
jgi:hypothetical protein